MTLREYPSVTISRFLVPFGMLQNATCSGEQHIQAGTSFTTSGIETLLVFRRIPGLIGDGGSVGVVSLHRIDNSSYAQHGTS
jgi:hypothetical protein